jgi:hypothetical protein
MGRNIPGINIDNCLQYALLPHNSDIPEPQGLDLFTKGPVEVGINEGLIENEYLLSKMAKEEYEMPQSESDVESESGEVDRKSDKSDNEIENDDDYDGDDDEDDDEDYLYCFCMSLVYVSYVRMVRLTTRQVEWSSHQKGTNKRSRRNMQSYPQKTDKNRELFKDNKNVTLLGVDRTKFCKTF